MRLPGVKFPIPRSLVRFTLRLTDFLEDHPRFTGTFLRPLASAPLVRDFLPVVVRAFMGATAFDCHVVDRERGWAIFGDVKGTMHPAGFTRVRFGTIVGELGEKEGKEAIMEVARESLYQEVKFGLEGKHIPSFIRPAVGRPETLDVVRADPDLLRLTEKGMNMVIRLIGDGGGWGRIRASMGRDPITVTLLNTLDVRYLGPSADPVCVEYVGLLEAVASCVTGRRYRAREVECQGAGAPRCLFELEPEDVEATTAAG